MVWSLTCIGIIPVTYWLYFKLGYNGDNSYDPNPLP